jgi:hypothetical protein
LTGVDSTIGASAATFKNARFWKYDTLLAAHGLSQELYPASKSRRRSIQLQVVSGNPTVFTVLVRVQAQNANPVPALPVFGIPPGIYADTNIVLDPPQMSGRVVKNIVEVIFKASATQAQRQAAIDSIRGTVVGGLPFINNGDGLYLVRIPSTSNADPVFAAIATLKAMSQVQFAGTHSLTDRGSGP